MKKILSVFISFCIISLAVFSNTFYSLAENTPIVYQTHVQDIGWQDWKSNGEIAGTEGQAKQLEAIKIKLGDSLNVKYRAHIEDIGWQDWKSNGETAGTEGQAKQLEAIQIILENNNSGYELEYRVHIQDIGWQDWKGSGEIAGTTGQAKQLEAIQIRFKEKSGATYQAHVEDIGWQDWKSDGKLAGTEGLNKQLEAIKISLNNVPSGMGIRYRSYVQGSGWQGWKCNGELSGTEGKGKCIESIQIELIGAPVGYRIEYRAHIQDHGWSAWVGSGKKVGTEGTNKQLEAIEIKLIKNNNNVVVIDPGHGGTDSGAVGAGFTEKFLNLEIALATAKYLRENGIEVYMTRETDKTVSLKDRTDFANSINPNLFISIHNDSGSNTATGAHVIYSTRDKNGGASKSLARNILDKITTMTTQNANGRQIWTKENSEGRDWYHILRESSNPAVIIECAFMNEIDIKSIERSSMDSEYEFILDESVEEEVSRDETIDQEESYIQDNENIDNNEMNTRAVDTPAKRDAMGKAIAYGILQTLNRN